MNRRLGSRLTTTTRKVSLAGLTLLLFCMALFFLAWGSGAPVLSTPVVGPQLVPTFDAGFYHSLAITDDGRLWAWGHNTYGQVGDGTTIDRWSPAAIGSATDWMTVAAGWDNALALKADGSLWAWGQNDCGQLGDGTTTDRSAPSCIGSASDWASVDTGCHHTLALKADGSLWSWGSNYYGQLGSGRINERHVPARVGTETDWVAISANGVFSLALKSDGTLWAWGCNYFGQLGDGTTVDRSHPTRIGADSDWVAIEAGYSHCLALKADGSLWAWGRNDCGQLGDGTTIERHSPTHIGTDTHWIAMSAGSGHSVALKADGSVWTWGCNSDGRDGALGDGTFTDRHVPTEIMTQQRLTWVAVAAGGSHSMFLGAGGALRASGYNLHGQVGDGTMFIVLTPTQVLTNVKLPTTPSPTTTTTTGSTTSSTTTTVPGTTTTTTVGPGPGTGFPDVPSGRPYYQAITHFAGAGIVNGYADGSFGPGDPVIRQQFAKMIVGTGGYPVSESDVCPFADVAIGGIGTFYPDNFVAVCAAQGITLGKTATTFDPYSNITRYQVISMVVRAADDLKPGALTTPPSGWLGSAGWGGDPTHGANAVLAEYNGLLAGLGMGSLDPYGNMTRGEVAQILYNLLQL